ncbi:MAG: helix-hairpin-helix domain-containing protein [Candidatus Cloacimonetes bacterium]|nr:helix-hairpin-helix domain-containing protein [Candidatus Cloacimonadota bacterium]
MKRLFLLILLAGICFLYAERVDLNTASLQQIEKLPITQQQAKDIYEYRQFTAFFKSIYDLRKIPSIDQETMLKLRPLVETSLYTDLDETEQRREEIYYLLERLGSTEGTQEGFSDIWEDYLMTPQNLNAMSYNDILNLPNVSPIDAAAVMRRIALKDTITDYRNLRSTSGLSYYGASNIRHYVFFKEQPTKQKLFMNYQLKYEDKSFDDDTRENLREIFKNKEDHNLREINHSYWGYFNLSQSNPAVMNKLRVRYGNNIKAGLLSANQRGESLFTENTFSENMKDAKYYAAYDNQFDFFGNTRLKAYLGNYRVTYGEGLVMENTDYYSSRKTGHGFSKRILGLTEDLSRTDEYALKGVAFSLENRYSSLSFYYSQDKKDAIVYDLNGDGSINSLDKDADGKYRVFSYVTSSVRFDNDDMEEAEAFFNQKLTRKINLSPRKDILDETIIGGRWEVSPVIGTHLGISGYQAIYDNANFVVYGADSIATYMIRDGSNEGKWNMQSSEIQNLYSTQTSSYKRDYRQILGFDWRTVIGNTSFSGEYAELSVDGKDLKIGDDPSATVVTAYTQLENFYFLSLFRHYDLGFDNPYSRGFSEHEKFDDTIIDKNPYTLTNPILADLYRNSAQAQAEKGVYFETRYKITTALTLNRTYLDIWERMSDGRRTVRFQGDMEYRPIYSLGLRTKYKNQVNRYDDDADRGVSKTNEISGMVTSYLSNRDRLQFEYRYTKVWGPPYPYLTNNAISPYEDDNPSSNYDSTVQSMVLMKGDFLKVDFTHNINDLLRVRTGIGYWNGHGVSHWDWEDMEIDFMGEQGLKYWVLLQNKIANNLYLSMRLRAKYYKTKELEVRTWWNESISEQEVYFRNVNKDDYAVRLQLDWRF